MRRCSTRFAVVLAGGFLLASCDDRTVLTAPLPETCGPYPAPATSPYRLPYPVGESSFISQGNCGRFTHSGQIRYAYDFSLAIGRTITAVRAGVVEDLREDAVDGVDTAINRANFVRIVHEDGTVASYAHLMENGVLVGIGEAVAQGQPIARAGLTGFTGGFPHLHFEIFACSQGCDTMAVTFRNADPPAPEGLQMGATYTALP